MADSKNTADVPGFQRRPGFLASRNAETRSGAVDRYEQSVEPTGPPTRADVEAQLRATSDSIASRLDALQTEMGFSVEAARSFVTKPLVSVGLTALAGLLIGRFIGSIRGSAESGQDALAEMLSDAVLMAQDEGVPVEQAIQRVLAITDLGHAESSKSGGLFRLLGLIALRSVLRQIVSEVASRFNNTEPDDPQFDDHQEAES